MRVLAFGTYDSRRHPRVRVLIDGLRSRGVDVQECNEPLSVSTAERVALLRRPTGVPVVLSRLLRCWGSLLWRSRGLSPDVVVVGYLAHFDAHIARLRFGRRPTLVVDMLVFARDTAVDRGLGGGWRGRALGLLDRAAVRAADVVLVDTAENIELIPRKQRCKAVVVAVGAEDRWFSSETSASELTSASLRVVFFGLFTPLQGAPVIGQAMSLLADEEIDFTVVGTGQDLEATRAAATGSVRVRWLDWVEYEALPELVARHHVSLGIFGTGRKALSVVPTKVYQGMAAGCVVVTSDTEPQRRILGDAAVYVPPGNAEALADALRQIHEDRTCLMRRSLASAVQASSFRPGEVVRPLLDRLLGERAS